MHLDLFKLMECSTRFLLNLKKRNFHSFSSIKIAFPKIFSDVPPTQKNIQNLSIMLVLFASLLLLGLVKAAHIGDNHFGDEENGNKYIYIIIFFFFFF